MKKLAVLSAVALIGLGTLASSEAEARSRNRNVAGAAIAAGVVGLAVGGLLASQAQAAPSYGYPAYSEPDYGYDPAPVRYRYVEEAPVVYRPVRRYEPEYAYGRPVTVRKTIIERRYETVPVYDTDGNDYGW
jgi:hypothetical protein